jgi:hypothetical protein
MTLYQFNILGLNERMEAVNQLGIFLDNCVSKTARSNLYAIDMFFVEVVYNPEFNTITEIRSFKYSETMNKYVIGFKKPPIISTKYSVY